MYIVHDGKLVERRLRFIEVAMTLTRKDLTQQYNEAVERYKEKQGVLSTIQNNEQNLACILDVIVSGKYYPMIIVGSFGYAIPKNIDPERLLSVTGATRVFTFNSLEDLRTLVSTAQIHVDELVEHIDQDVVPYLEGFTIDYELFRESEVWKRLKEYRKEISAKHNTQERFIFTIREAMEVCNGTGYLEGVRRIWLDYLSV